MSHFCVLFFVFAIYFPIQAQRQKDLSSVLLALSQDEAAFSSKHRHAVENLEPDPAKTIFNVVSGRNPLQRTTASPRLSTKKHIGAVIVNSTSRRGRRSTDEKEKPDHEYDTLLSDFSEDEKEVTVTKDPLIWSTRVIGSAEVINPQAIEAPINEHRIHVPSHLVERVSEDDNSTSISTTTQKALNLFSAITISPTTNDSIIMDEDESSGQEPAPKIDKDLFRSILATKLSQLFVAPELDTAKVAKTIIPNKIKDPLKRTTKALLISTTTVKSVKLPSSDVHADQLEEERLLEKRTEIVPITEESAKLLDGNVEKQRKILSNFVPDHLQRAEGLTRKRRQAKNSSDVKIPATFQRQNISAEKLEQRTTTKIIDKTDNSSTTTSIKEEELRDIVLDETAANVDKLKQGIIKEQTSEEKSIDTTRQSIPSSTPQPQTFNQPVQFEQSQAWIPPQQPVMQPNLNHFVVGNRRVVIPSISYEQHVSQQFWPFSQQQAFVPQFNFMPPQFQPAPIRSQPPPIQMPTNQVQPAPIRSQPPPIPQVQIPVNEVPRVQQIPTTSQRPALLATTEAPLVRTTQNVLPDIIHTSTAEPQSHIKFVNFDLYDEVGGSATTKKAI